ncbi:MAG: CHAD domain-containing protein [Rhodovarius sp.]|nr:CHAD domain-containing protein [Rhodovarius sp.]MDW8314864.1 CHAD domain-containing protein [Rhodovarius sp.]
MLPPLGIVLPPASLPALLRHPALRVPRGARGAWQPVSLPGFIGRCRRLSPPGARPVLTLLEGQLTANGVAEPHLRLVVEGPGGAALGALLAARLPALPAFTTLEESAAALAEGRPALPPERVSDAPGPAAALAIGLRAGLALLLHHAPACRADGPPLAVHQSRVAIRRMRSQLRLFRPALAGLVAAEELDAFAAGLKELAAVLGPARDWDVFRDGIGALLAAALPGEPRLSALLEAAEGARRSAYAALAPVLAGPGFRALIWRGVALIEALEAAADPTPLPDFAAAVLEKRHRRLRRDGEEIETLPPEGLHQLRIDAKKLRYAAELLAPLWPNSGAKRYLKRLARLQDALGLANDAAVARGLVAGLAVEGWARGLVEGFALARAVDSREMALHAWARWRKAKRFWQAE